MRKTLERMEILCDEETCIKIREFYACKPPKFLRLAQDIRKRYPEMSDILSELEKAKIAGNSLKLIDDKIFGVFSGGKCLCFMLKGITDGIPILYCHCCKGHIKWLFESILDKQQNVVLTHSVITGDDECRCIVEL